MKNIKNKIHKNDKLGRYDIEIKQKIIKRKKKENKKI